jgi:hypothetical protein
MFETDHTPHSTYRSNPAFRKQEKQNGHFADLHVDEEAVN